MPTTKQRWMIATALAAAALIATPVVVVANFAISQAVGRTTVVTAADGSERTVYWRDYPGVAGLDPEDVLDGPSVEEGYAAGEAMVAEIRSALTEEFGLEWAPDPNEGERFDPFHDGTQNWFGGESLLTNVNAPTSQSTSVPTSWEAKQRAIEIIGKFAAEYGFSDPVLDHDRHDLWTEEDRIRDLGGPTPETQVIVSGVVEGPTGQWLGFTFQDLSKDVDGRFEERFAPSTEHGWQPNTVSISYGANALLRDELRDEFERRLEPFLGLTPPPPLET